MPISVQGTQITYNDSSNQGTAYIGGQGTFFTSGNTAWTVPTGITALRCRAIGSGGGGGGNNSAGNAGGTTSFGSYISITGGGGGRAANSGNPAAGGSASSGTLNYNGNPANIGPAQVSYEFGTNEAGASFGRGGQGGTNIGQSDGGPGGGGGNSWRYVTGLTPGGTVNVTIGAAGNGSTQGGTAGGSGMIEIHY